MNKKKEKLGMNPSTARNRLVKNLLFKYIKQNNENICFRCNKEMTFDNFTIDHKEPWLNSEKPVDLYFDLNNISFSHHSCNSKFAEQQYGKENPNSKKIIAVDINTKETINFDSVIEGSKFIIDNNKTTENDPKRVSTKIVSVLRGYDKRQEHIYGFKWFYR